MNGTSPTRSKRASRASAETSDLGLGDEEGCLGGIALDRPFPFVLAQDSVVGEAATREHEADLVEQQRVVERAPVDPQLALGPVAPASDVHLARGGDDLLDRHLVPGQRPRLVRADNRGRPKRLHRRELLHDRPPARHALHAEGEHDGQHGRQPFRHRRDRERHADEEHVDEVGCLLDVGREQDGRHDDDRDDDDGDPERAPDVGDLALKRCALLFGTAEQTRDVAHLGGHAGSGHDGPPPPARDGGAVEHHVHPVAETRRLAERCDVLQHRFALARQRCFGNSQRSCFHEPAIRAYRVALRQQQDIARHDLRGGDAILAPFADDVAVAAAMR